MDSELTAGAIAGFAATIPMTVAMSLMHKRLPPHEQYPLPPSEITAQVEEQTVGLPTRPGTHIALTMLAHFGYGTAAGTLYAPLARQLRLSPLTGGISFGLLVWTISYLGLLPVLGILTPATRHPARRNTLMIGAHVVWGTALALILEKLQEEHDDG